MRSKKDAVRWSRKAIRVGHSLAVTLPYDLAQAWGVTPGQELVMYQIDQALVVLPLQQVLKRGLPRLVESLQTQLQ